MVERHSPPLVLASGSPRRSELLRAAGITFRVCAPAVEEWPYEGGEPAEYADSLARAKAESVGGERVVAADTIVVIDGRVLGKPGGAEAAEEMLGSLSGRSHEVITAVAVKDRYGLRSAQDSARVTFRELSEPEIRDYVASGEPLDKAGGYGFQGAGRQFVERLEGDPETVIGLPLRLLRSLLAPRPDP